MWEESDGSTAGGWGIEDFLGIMGIRLVVVLSMV